MSRPQPPDHRPDHRPDQDELDNVQARALEAANAGDYQRAAALLSRALELQPDEPDHHSNLGSVLHLLGDLPGALAAHQRALHLARTLPAPQRPPAQRMAWYHYNLGVTLAASGDLPRAQDAYGAAIEHDPGMIDAHTNLGTSFQTQGDTSQAEDAYRRALALAPQNPVALRNLGSVLAATGRLDQAEDAYRRAALHSPEDPGVLCDLAALYRARDALERALDTYARAASLAPDAASIHTHHGLVASALGRVDIALESHERAISLAPEDITAHSARGATLARAMRLSEAIPAFERALELAATQRPDWARPHYNLGVVLHRAGHLARAVSAYHAALERNRAASQAPDTAERANILGNLADCLVRLGRHDQAAARYRELLEARPDDATARHLLHALADETSERPPPGYVQHVFDDYAPRFDAHLVRDLGYRVPEEMADAIDELLAPSPDESCAILDLGCGTGLVGQHLHRPARVLHGVDLSPAMLALARDKGVYQAVYQRDLIDFLTDPSLGRPHYQVITAADVLIYLGTLEPLFSAVRERLSPGGIFAFTIEEERSGPPVRLRPTGRYAHSREYIETLCSAERLRRRSARAIALRKENERVEEGVLYLLQRPAP